MLGQSEGLIVDERERARASFAFLQGWFHAAVLGLPCDPPVDITALGYAAHHAWVDGWCIAQDQRARGVDVLAADEAHTTCDLYLAHKATPRGAMS